MRSFGYRLSNTTGRVITQRTLFVYIPRYYVKPVLLPGYLAISGVGQAVPPPPNLARLRRDTREGTERVF